MVMLFITGSYKQALFFPPYFIEAGNKFYTIDINSQKNIFGAA